MANISSGRQRLRDDVTRFVRAEEPVTRQRAILLGEYPAKVRIIHQLVRREARCWVDHEHLLGEHSGLVAHSELLRHISLIWERILPAGNHLVEVLRVLALERETAAEHGIEKNAGGPDVGGWAQVVSPLDDLRRHVRRSSAENLQLGLGWRAAAKAKINEFDDLLAVNDDVFKLDVSVRDVALMEIVQSQEKLLDESFGLLFSELPVRLRLQMGVQTLACGVLHDEVNILGRVYALVQFHDVRMVELGQDLDLPDGLLLPLQVQKLVPVVLLDRDSLARFPVDRLLDFGVGAPADELAQRVVVYLRAVWRGELVVL